MVSAMKAIGLLALISGMSPAAVHGQRATPAAVTGIGLEHLVTEEMNQSIGGAGTVVLFSVVQGILAAAGSRLVRAVRGRYQLSAR